MRQPGPRSGNPGRQQPDVRRRQPLIWLVIAIFAWPLPVPAQVITAKAAIANHRTTDNVCVAADFAAASALVKDDEVRRGENAALGAAPPHGFLATLGKLQAQANARAYLRETAWTSATMTRQGPEVAIARLNPWFAARLARAIHEARASGLPTAGVFSAYRPPAFGVGRFLDRFSSLHAYGLAVDMRGIGDPHSKEAKLWYDIAERHGIVCPYGVDSRREWNHCQATPAKVVCRDNPLRNTITAQGPIDLAEMFKVGNWFVDNPPGACAVVTADRTTNAQAVVPHRTFAMSVAASARSDRKHVHQARNMAGRGIARAQSTSHEASMRMVAHDMRLGASHPKTRRPR